MLAALILPLSHLLHDRGESYSLTYDIFVLTYTLCYTYWLMQVPRLPNYPRPSFVLSLRSDSIDSIGYLWYLTVIPTQKLPCTNEEFVCINTNGEPPRELQVKPQKSYSFALSSHSFSASRPHLSGSVCVSPSINLTITI